MNVINKNKFQKKKKRKKKKDKSEYMHKCGECPVLKLIVYLSLIFK